MSICDAAVVFADIVLEVSFWFRNKHHCLCHAGLLYTVYIRDDIYLPAGEIVLSSAHCGCSVCTSMYECVYVTVSGVSGIINERTNEVYLPMNGVNNNWLPVEAEAHQSWPPKNKKKLTN